MIDLKHTLVGMVLMSVGLILIYYVVSWFAFVVNNSIVVSAQGWFLLFLTAITGNLSFLLGTYLFARETSQDRGDKA